MRVEGGLAEQKGWEQAAASFAEPQEANNSSKKNKRRQKKSPAMPTLVQKLFDTCREVFSDGREGTTPSATDVERIRSVLDHMNPTDVGLNQNMPYFGNFENRGGPPVTYLHVYECDSFSIGIFCFPPSGVIPLHNHPGMTVFGKLLFGSIHIKSYDWADSSQEANASTSQQALQRPGMRLAKVKTDGTFTAPCSTSILYPAAGGNMHRLTAVTSCAVLDVLGPPYSDDEGRPCTYYNDFPCVQERSARDAMIKRGSQQTKSVIPPAPYVKRIKRRVWGIPNCFNFCFVLVVPFGVREERMPSHPSTRGQDSSSIKLMACVGTTTTCENHPNPSSGPAVLITKRRTHGISSGQR